MTEAEREQLQGMLAELLAELADLEARLEAVE